MPSARPISGASSTEPLTSITSTWRPVASKWRSAIRGYLVAIRIIPRRRSDSPRLLVAPAAGEHHAAAAEAEVEQLVDDAVGLLEQHVLAGDADVGGAGLDVGGHVGGAHRHQGDALALEDQRARLAAHLAGVDADRVERVERLAEQGAARHRQLQRPLRLGVAHAGDLDAHGSPPVRDSSSIWATWTRSRYRAKPAAGRSTPKRLSSPS